MPVLEARNIHKKYDLKGREINALKGVSLTVAAGEILLINGRSGAGKTSLLHVIAGLEPPDEGEVRYDGKILNCMSQEALAAWRGAHLGFVFQSNNLLHHLDLRQNVMLPLIYSGYREDEIEKRADEILAFMGLKERSNHRPDELSGGERQRGALARALICSPVFILADEPTAELDEQNASLFYNLAARLASESGIGFIIVSHDPMAAYLGVKPMRLEAGRWIE